MKKRLLLLVAALFYLLLPATAFAYNPLDTACAGAKSSDACGTTGANTISGSGGVIEKVALIIATIAGIAAVIIIIYAGFTYVTAGGNSQRIESARNAIIGAIVGLVIIIAAASIITFVVNKV